MSSLGVRTPTDNLTKQFISPHILISDWLKWNRTVVSTFLQPEKNLKTFRKHLRVVSAVCFFNFDIGAIWRILWMNWFHISLLRKAIIQTTRKRRYRRCGTCRPIIRRRRDDRLSTVGFTKPGHSESTSETICLYQRHLVCLCCKPGVTLQYDCTSTWRDQIRLRHQHWCSDALLPSYCRVYCLSWRSVTICGLFQLEELEFYHDSLVHHFLSSSFSRYCFSLIRQTVTSKSAIFISPTCFSCADRLL